MPKRKTHWLVNGRSRKRSGTTRKRTRVHRARKARTVRRVSSMKRKRNASRRRRRAPVARRRRRSTTRRRVRRNAFPLMLANPRRRRRRSARRGYRRNPPFSVSGIVARVQDVAMGAAAAFVGKVGSKFAVVNLKLVPGVTEKLARVALGVAGGMAAEKFAGAKGRQIGRDFALGAVLGVMESVTRELDTQGVVTGYLGDASDYQVYAMTNGARLGSYPLRRVS